LANKIVYVERPQFSPCQNVLPSNYSGIPKSSLHAQLKEHRDGPNGITSVLNVKIGDGRTSTKELIGGVKIQILLINLGPLRCRMSTGIEYSVECSHWRSNEVVSDTISAPCLMLDVEMELLHVGGPLLMMVVLQFPLCLYELQRLVINVDDRLLC
jgi:hypothetical protein